MLSFARLVAEMHAAATSVALWLAGRRRWLACALARVLSDAFPIARTIVARILAVYPR
jgi:hypothetical protein